MKPLRRIYVLLAVTLLAGLLQTGALMAADSPRERISINDDWRFTRGDPPNMTAHLTLLQIRGGPRAAAGADGGQTVNESLWPYLLATGNDFTNDPAKKVARPAGNPAEGIAYASASFADSSWRQLDLPHDFGIEGPFLAPGQPGSNGSTGRLPFFGQVWYRKHLSIPASDSGKLIYLDVDGAMAYAIVFVNGQLVGGWPYGYSSWRLNLTPYIKPGADNTLAIRLDNPPNSSRWYPGGGIYRNVWLVKTNPVHISQWGTYVTTPKVSAASADVQIRTTVENNTMGYASVSIAHDIVDASGKTVASGEIKDQMLNRMVAAVGSIRDFTTSITVPQPQLWSPQTPAMYVLKTRLTVGGKVVDEYDTPFGIRTVKYDPNAGLSINGEHYKINGVCDHHDLGALGTAINFRASSASSKC